MGKEGKNKMTTKSREEIIKMASEMLEEDEGLRRALEVFQLGQTEFLKALASTQSIQVVSDDKTSLLLSSIEGNRNEELD